MPTPPHRKRGRPPKYVLGRDGKPIVGLSRRKSDGRYYATHTKPTVYFGNRFDDAVIRFREWDAKQKGEKGELAVPHPVYERPLVSFEEWEAKQRGEPVDLTVPRDIKKAMILEKGSAVVDTVLRIEQLPADLLWPQITDLLTKDLDHAAEMTGLPLNRLHKFKKPKESLPLSVLSDNWVKKRRKRPLTTKWKRDVLAYWDEFTKMIGVQTTRAITEEHVHAYADTILGRYESEDLSASFVENRFTAIKSILKTSTGKDPEARRALDICADPIDGLIAPVGDASATPISVEDYHALLEGSSDDPKMRAMLLVALNACYYPSDVAAVRVDEIDIAQKTIINRRSKKNVVRVCCLWDRTVKAIKGYQRAGPHQLPTLFRSSIGLPYSSAHIARRFRRLRAEVGLLHVKFRDIRDAAYTEATSNTEDMMLGAAKVLAGHKLSGVSDDYILRNPRHVKGVCERIEKAFFGGRKKTTSKAT